MPERPVFKTNAAKKTIRREKRSPKRTSAPPPPALEIRARPFDPLRDGERIGRYHTELLMRQHELWQKLANVPFSPQETRKKLQNQQEQSGFVRQLAAMTGRGQGAVLLFDTPSAEAVGYAFVTEAIDPITFDRIGVIGEVYLEEAFRGRGAGAIALQEAEKWFSTRKIDTVQVFVTRTNAEAVELYQKSGYAVWDYRMVKRTVP